MPSNGLAEYHEFLNFREELIQQIYSISVSHEVKNGEIVRPVGVITTDEEYIHFKGALLKWDETVNYLNSLDPDTYPLSAAKFKPVTGIIDAARAISVSINTSTAVRDINKDVLIRRFKSHIKSLRDNPSPASSALIEHLQKEVQAMEDDEETVYTSRNSNGTETNLIVYPIVGQQYKIRVPFAGALIDNRFGDINIGKAKEISQRQDGVDYLGVEPIACSLPNVSGRLYPKSAIERAKRIARESKIPIGD